MFYNYFDNQGKKMDCWLCEWVGGFGLGDWKEDTDDLMWRNGQVCDLGFRRQDIRQSQWMGVWSGQVWDGHSHKKRRKKFQFGKR